MKFKVGDKVKILRKDDTFGWDQDMARDIGYTFLLGEESGVDKGWLINGYYWSEDALELISEVGECVKNNDNCDRCDKEVPTYTEEEIVAAFSVCHDYASDLISELRRNRDSTYKEYLRLKAIYEG